MLSGVGPDLLRLLGRLGVPAVSVLKLSHYMQGQNHHPYRYSGSRGMLCFWFQGLVRVGMTMDLSSSEEATGAKPS